MTKITKDETKTHTKVLTNNTPTYYAQRAKVLLNSIKGIKEICKQYNQNNKEKFSKMNYDQIRELPVQEKNKKGSAI